MFLSGKFKALTLSMALTLYAVGNVAYAQTSPTQILVTNQFPCAECAVYDNNGHDLRGFMNTNKKELYLKGNTVNEYSNNTWGYLQIGNAHVPSLNKQGNLDYTEYIDATLALLKTPDGAKATWWARQTNAPRGALVYIKTEDKDKLDIPNIRYTDLIHELDTKKFTLVEYYNETYNITDYDVLFGNYILMKAGTIKDVNDYKLVVDYFSNFLSKFSRISDPMMEGKSFLTFLNFNNHKYFACFNIVNSKLAGRLMIADIQYETDKLPVTQELFKKLTGRNVFIYGDDLFGMEKTIIKYARPKGIKLIRKKTTDTKSFNEEKWPVHSEL